MNQEVEASRRFSGDVIWNVASLAVAGGSGILLNYLIGQLYDAQALGIFNQVFAFYLVFSQLAALGFHYSALKYIAASEEHDERTAIATTALIATGAVGVVATALFFVCAEPAGALLRSPEVAKGVVCAAPGVLFFALSKVVLGCLNGLGRIRLYATFFGGRFVLLVAAFLVCAMLERPRAELPIILSISEAATWILSVVTLRAYIGRIPLETFRHWCRVHFVFGVKGFMSGTLSELNTRVDILILGYYVNDRVVGAYSFAAVLAEGLYQLPVVLRAIFAPVVIKQLAQGRLSTVVAGIRRARNKTYLVAVPVAILATLGYIGGVPLLTSDPDISNSWPYFAVLLAGMTVSAGYVPFQQLLIYAGMPGFHTLLMLGFVLSNALLNVALIALWGALGSAIATALAFAFGVVILKMFVARLMHIHI